MKDISRILNQLESISTKSNGYSSRTDGTQKYENINTNGNYYAFQDENRRLNAELQNTKSRQGERRLLVPCLHNK